MAAGRLRPWLSEPGSWLHIEDDGLVQAAARGGGGAWCGYLGIPKSMAYDHTVNVRVHGGLSYEGAESPRYLPATDILAMAVSGHEMPVFWIGFDCSHFGDLVPEYSWSEGTYRDLKFVQLEIQRMVRQVRGMKEP